jgi:hypothetical protein
MRHEEVENMFTYHPPVGNQTERYGMIREAGRRLAHTINVLAPGAEEAVKLVQLATMKANAAIACNDTESTPNIDMDPVKLKLESLINGDETVKETPAHVPDPNDPFHNDQPKH